MGIRTIKNKAGKIIGFQALAGAGAGPDSTSYVSVKALGSEAAARRAAEGLASAMKHARPRRVYGPRLRNASGIPGLRFEYRMYSAFSGPILYAVATWFKDGRNVQRAASTQRHGLLGAVQRMRLAREAATGRPIGLTDRQALNRMKSALEV